MPRLTLVCALCALCCSIAALVVSTATRATAELTLTPSWQRERDYPPLVFESEAWLDCNISNTDTGLQALHTIKGAGFNFTTPMLPIEDGKVHLASPGMEYSFAAFPPAAFPATFVGLGEGMITEFRTEVEVAVDRYDQPEGPGSAIHFNGADISADSAYVEFTGLFVRKADNKRFPFRVVFGVVEEGEGTVWPTSPDPDTEIMAKMVIVGSPRKAAQVITALYEEEEEVRSLTEVPTGE